MLVTDCFIGSDVLGMSPLSTPWPCLMHNEWCSMISQPLIWSWFLLRFLDFLGFFDITLNLSTFGKVV